jgi:hypothetical protein
VLRTSPSIPLFSSSKVRIMNHVERTLPLRRSLTRSSSSCLPPRPTEAMLGKDCHVLRKYGVRNLPKSSPAP